MKRRIIKYNMISFIDNDNRSYDTFLYHKNCKKKIYKVMISHISAHENAFLICHIKILQRFIALHLI